MSTGLVSVIIPAYNAAGTIRETLESALAQTYRDLEILVVDDGSTDSTAEIAEAYVARDPRVRVLREDHAGSNAARNRALRHARGDLIAPLDADDLWHPEKIGAQVGLLRRAGPEVGLVYAWSWSIDEASRCIPLMFCAHEREGDVLGNLVLNSLPGNGSSPLIPKACLTEVGGFPDAAGYECCDDFRLYLALAERYDFAVVRRFLVGYRQRRGSKMDQVASIHRTHGRVLDDVRRGHPELPTKLFRWSQARTDYFLARKCLRTGRLREGASLLVKVLRRDPAFLFGLPIGRELRNRLIPPGDPGGKPFLPPPLELVTYRSPGPAWLERRRQRYSAQFERSGRVPGPRTAAPRVSAGQTGWSELGEGRTWPDQPNA